MRLGVHDVSSNLFDLQAERGRAALGAGSWIDRGEYNDSVLDAELDKDSIELR